MVTIHNYSLCTVDVDKLIISSLLLTLDLCKSMVISGPYSPNLK